MKDRRVRYERMEARGCLRDRKRSLDQPAVAVYRVCAFSRYFTVDIKER